VDEVWSTDDCDPRRPEGLDIVNPAFETVARHYISGIITEIGVIPPSVIGREFNSLFPELVYQD